MPKNFYEIDTLGQFHKPFVGIIYAAIGGCVNLTKKLYEIGHWPAHNAIKVCATSTFA
jgi:hypothetical protein